MKENKSIRATRRTSRPHVPPCSTFARRPHHGLSFSFILSPCHASLARVPRLGPQLLSGHYDTTIGGKMESESYRRIAQEAASPPSSILFLSDRIEGAGKKGVDDRVTHHPLLLPIPKALTLFLLFIQAFRL